MCSTHLTATFFEAYLFEKEYDEYMENAKKKKSCVDLLSLCNNSRGSYG